jgi:hypothetical protein
MKNFPYDYMYLGFALSFFANLFITDWRFYAVLIPFAILEKIRNFKK